MVALVAAVTVLGACAREEKVVYYKPFFAGLEGVETQTPAVYDDGRDLLKGARGGGEGATSGSMADELVVTDKNGRKHLLSRSGVQLMHHIRTQLAGNDAQLFADQVLCEATRAEFRERGRDPKEAFYTLKAKDREIGRLFGRMPMGEHSPSVIMQPLGKNVFRVRVTGPAARGLDGWTGFDMVLEGGNYRLRWFL